MQRKEGRPAKVGPALCTKGPSNVITINEYVETGNEEAAVVVIDWPDTVGDTVPQDDILIDEMNVTVDNTVSIDCTLTDNNTVPQDNLKVSGVIIPVDNIEFINDSVPVDNTVYVTVSDTVNIEDIVSSQNDEKDNSKKKNDQI